MLFPIPRYVLSFLLSAVIVRFIIFLSKRIYIGQPISRYLPHHLVKQGTATLGGIGILLSFFIVTLQYPYYKNTIWIYRTVIICFITGLLDDLHKITYKDNRGLSPNQKLFIMAIPILIVLFLEFGLSIWTFLYFAIIIASTAAFDVTDGLDGLLSSISIVIFITMGILFPELYSICMIISGSILGFLTFNLKPARIFMGDCGALSIGAVFGCCMIHTGEYIPLLTLAIVPIIELFSVIVKKLLIGAKLKHNFFIAPIHHTFEKKIGEANTVYLFLITTLIFALITYFYLT